MSAPAGDRLTLICGSQCSAAPQLSFLPDLAHDLGQVLTDPALGGCKPALDSGPVLIDPPWTDLIQAVRDAFAQANGDGAVLVLAFIGHGIAVDDDFYFLPSNGSGQGLFDSDVHLSQLLKEGLNNSPNLGGLLVLLDTCYAGVGAAQAARWQEVGLGRRIHRYELLTSSADQPAYGGQVTRVMIDVLRAGIATAGTTIGSRYLHSSLRKRVKGQQPQRITHEGGGWARPDDEGLWWAYNLAHPSRRPEPVTPVGSVVPSGRAYLEQVARIAPEWLVARDQELADMAAFCTRPDAGSYWYWRAGPWTGKSALMAWFVLHPPAGVSVVSFFITARYAGQSDRIAFTEAVVEQLAALLGEPKPMLAEASREYHLLHLLARAGERCQERGERLVLVVDGLDEDRGVTTGPDAYSIAALLPEKPPHGVRIIVAGRENPPVPDDVPPGHPLYNPDVMHLLVKSEQAEVVQNDMRRELAHLLDGTPKDKDLLGLLTAAGGGLSANDLAELTGQLEWRVEEHLGTVAGRSFSRRNTRWSPDQAVYILGHEELQKTATERIGPQRLDEYRQRLHTWAETYREQHWPPNTPEYLLRGYYRLVATTGDLPRLVTLATDADRHDRMLDLSGGDTAALEEIATAQSLVLAEPIPNLESTAFLSIHRNNLADRNANIPTGLPAIWAKLGQPDRAEALARAIPNPDSQARALTGLVTAVAATGDTDRAEQIAHTITDPYSQAQGLIGLVTAVASTGDTDRAEQLAHTITNPYSQVQALTSLVTAIASTGDTNRAHQIATQAEQLAHTITEPYWQAQALTSLVTAIASTGDTNRAHQIATQAEQLAHTITNPYWQAEALTGLVTAIASTGDTNRAHQIATQAEQLAHTITNLDWQAQALTGLVTAIASTGDTNRAHQIAHTITNPRWQVQALTSLVTAIASTGDTNRAHQIATQAEQLAHTITNPYWQAEALTGLVTAIASTGDTNRAHQIAHTITNPYWQAEALTGLVTAIASTGDTNRAHQIATQAEQLAHTITNPYSQVQALTGLVTAIASTGDTNRAHQIATQAEQLAHTITNPYSQVQALTSLVTAIASTGNTDRAEQLAHTITNPYSQVQALTSLVTAIASTGDTNRAHQIATQAEQLAHTITEPYLQAQALTGQVTAVAATGDTDRAEQLAHTITDPYSQAQALTSLVTAIASTGDTDRAEQLAHTITNPYSQAQALTSLVTAIASTGNTNRAHQIAHTITDPRWQAEALTSLVTAIASTGDTNRAHQIATQAEQLAHTITEPRWQAQALTSLVTAIASTGDTNRAHQIATQAEQLAHTITDPRWQAEALTGLVTAIASTGDTNRAHQIATQAEQLAHTITDPDSQAEALIRLAAFTESAAAHRLLGTAFAIGPWWTPLSALARIAPEVVLRVADVVLRDERS